MAAVDATSPEDAFPEAESVAETAPELLFWRVTNVRTHFTTSSNSDAVMDFPVLTLLAAA